MDLTKFSFIDTARGIRGGFSHTSHLREGNAVIATGKAHWGNRTWEFAPFWTSRKAAIKKAMAVKGVTKDRLAELQALLDTYKD